MMSFANGCGHNKTFEDDELTDWNLNPETLEAESASHLEEKSNANLNPSVTASVEVDGADPKDGTEDEVSVSILQE